MANYYSYEEVEAECKEPTTCCECHSQLGVGSLYWFLSCRRSKAKKSYDTYHTCQECHDARQLLQDGFTPSGLLQDLQRARAETPYDDSRMLSLLHAAIGALCVRLRVAALLPHGQALYGAARCARGGWRG